MSSDRVCEYPPEPTHASPNEHPNVSQSLLVGSRIRFGNAWARVERITDDQVYAVLEGQNMLVVLPKEACAPTDVDVIAKRVRRFQRQKTLNENFSRLDQRRTASMPQRRSSRRQGTSREQRPTARRAAAAVSSGDPPPEPGDDEPPLDLARLLTAADRRDLKILVDRRRRQVVAAGLVISEHDRRLFDGDRA